MMNLTSLSALTSIFGLFLMLLWVLVPFAIFGIKPLLRQLIQHTAAVERQNVELLAALRARAGAPVEPPQG